MSTTPHTDDRAERHERIMRAIDEWSQRNGRRPPIDKASRYRRRPRRLRPGLQRIREIIAPLFDELAGEMTEGAA